MRIVAGKYRGRVLAGFRGEAIRPTSDRVKESLFQILTPRLAGARVLDLFAGSGALALEALSRGAREAVVNDLSRESLALCKKNFAAVRERAEFLNSDFRACLMRVTGKFDVVFSDPPYAEDVTAEVCRLLAARQLLAEGGVLVAESEREEETPAGFERVDFRSYGRTKIALFGRKA